MVELGGNLVTSGLSTCQSFGGQGSCYMGTECFTEKETDCRVTRAVYRSECTTCRQQGLKPSIYVGTTGCTTHKRQIEHHNLISAKNTSNALSKHHWREHPLDAPKFETTLIKGGLRFNVDRFICESLEIERSQANPDINTLNQRSEWGHRGIPRLAIISD